MTFSPAPFTPTPYTPPDFTLPHLAAAPDVTLVPAPKDFVAPEGYHAMSIYPEYLKIAGQWTLARDSRMDCVAVVEGGNVFVREFRHIRAGDLIACGRTENGEEGILVYTDGFRGLATSEDGAPHPGGHDNFAFRLGRSRETAFSRDYDELYELLRHDRDHGSIVWVMGPAFTFNGYSREAFAKIIDAGYADAVFAGNALATHDLEGAYFHTSLGQDIDTQENRPNGHYHHLGTINRVRYWGSIERFIEEEGVHDGIMNALVRNGVPYVLAGSIRDDGPLPGVYGNAYEAQDAMRDHIRSATTVICMATMLHTIATGNMTPPLPRAGRRHHSPGVLLLRGYRRVRCEQISGSRQPRQPRHRHQRPGLHRQHRQRIGAFGLEGCATSERSSPTTTLLSTAFPNGSAIGAMPSR